MKAQTQAEWLAHHLPVMRKLKKPTLPQSVILELAGKPDPTKPETKRLATAVTAEKAFIKASQAQNRLGAIVARANTADRKRETRSKFILGDLALAEARTNPDFVRILLPLVKQRITDARNLAVLAPLIEELTVVVDELPRPIPEPAPKKKRRAASRAPSTSAYTPQAEG